MLCFRLSTTLLLAAMCLLNPAVASVQKVITCDSGTAGKNVQRLSCVAGVIRVKSAFYGREDSDTCSAGVDEAQRTDTSCSRSGILDALKGRCDGRKVCELNLNYLNDPDPCSSTNKYLSTTYGCFPAIPVTECEGSVAHLHCPYGRVIFVYGAYYGRTNHVTCSYGRHDSNIETLCYNSVTGKVSDSCNGKTSCTVDVSSSLDDDPCDNAWSTWVSTYHYLEAAYTCQYRPLTNRYGYHHRYRNHVVNPPHGHH